MNINFDLFKDYKRVFIQPHDFPDADAISSAFGLSELVTSLTNLACEIIYFGPEADKPSIVTLIDELGIELTNYPKTSELELEDDDLLICVDCHHFGSNVTKVFAKNVAYVDHHDINAFEQKNKEKAEEEGFKYIFEILDSNAGSCSSIVSTIAENNNYIFSMNASSALTVGIMKDTKQLTTNYQPIDHKAIGYLYGTRDNEKVNLINRVNYSQEDTKLVVELFNNIKVYGNIAISYLNSCPDNNTVGQLADLLCEVEDITIAALYVKRLDYYRFSVRSFEPLINPSHLINHITKGIGGGGGKKYEAAGSIDKYQFSQLYKGTDIHSYVTEKVVEYANSAFTITSGVDNPFEIMGEDVFDYVIKKKYNVRYMFLDGIIGEGETLIIRTKEGIIEADSGKVLIFGVEGEIYPIGRDVFYRVYVPKDNTDEVAICDGSLPKDGIFIKTKDREITIALPELMNCSIAQYDCNDVLSATYISRPFMVNVKGGTLTAPNGGYLVVRSLNDIYICDEKIFKITFRKISKEILVGGIHNV